jgi:hypothetical protein
MGQFFPALKPAPLGEMTVIVGPIILKLLLVAVQELVVMLDTFTW